MAWNRGTAAADGLDFGRNEGDSSVFCKYGFAEIDDANSRVKINRAFKRILAQNIT